MLHKTKRSWVQLLLFLAGGLVYLYAILVLVHASTSYEIGVQSIFTPQVVGKPRNEKRVEQKEGLGTGDRIAKIGSITVHRWADLLQAPDILADRLQEGGSFPWLDVDPKTGQKFVQVIYEPKDAPHGVKRSTWCELRRVPLEEIIPSILWLFLKGALFVVGIFVYWKRPDDESALRFYILCVITVGAYVGGYHWSHIVTRPTEILIFMACAILMPVAGLHFYLVFPRKKPWLEQHPRLLLALIYGVPCINLFTFIGFYFAIRGQSDSDPLLSYLPWLLYPTFAMAALWHLASFAALVHSWWTIQDPIELNQVKCILLAIGLSMFPIGYSLYIVLAEPEEFAAGAVTWPMFVASLIVTVGFAIGMTRYRLMELDTIINSSLGYVFVSFLAGLMYYGVVFVGTLFYSRFVSHPTMPAALTVSTSALLFVVALDLARNRVKKALDRRFSHNKSQLDHTLQQMSQAVSQLVDPPVLAQRLLTTIAETLGVQRGAVYLRQDEPPGYRLAASLGAELPMTDLADGTALVECMKRGLDMEAPARYEGPRSPAQEQLQRLGAQVAQPLMHDGALLALLVLGAKDTPYRSEDWTLLTAFAQITVVALASAGQHRTIEQLHRDLQTKVDKIAEQQRRILTLQTQLHRQTATEKIVHRIEPVEKPPAAANGNGNGNGNSAEPPATGIVGSSAIVQQLLNLVRKVAATDAVVLLRGESGTGKELLARAVHETSPRGSKPYVKVHCAALSPHLLESELFGHVKGAFTGAHRDKVGRFELANGGTLFLDEIGDISLDVQTKLLRVLQERTFERVGSSDTSQTDVRIIAATHQNLEELIRRGRFREDLFYRLNVFPVQVPALRQRREDIPELVLHFVQQAGQRCRKNLLHLEDDAMAALKGYAWPGNIRELENVIERAVVIAEGDTLTVRELPAEIMPVEPFFGNGHDTEEPAEAEAALDPVATSLRGERERFEREQILRVFSSASGNKAEAARILGMARSTLVSRMRKLGLT